MHACKHGAAGSKQGAKQQDTTMNTLTRTTKQQTLHSSPSSFLLVCLHQQQINQKTNPNNAQEGTRAGLAWATSSKPWRRIGLDRRAVSSVPLEGSSGLPAVGHRRASVRRRGLGFRGGSGGLQRVEIVDDMLEGEGFLLCLFGDAIDLFEGRDPADHLQHAISVKC